MNILEYALARKLAGGGSTPAVVEPLSVTENGTYTPPEGVDGYNPVTVNVASSGGSENEWFNDGNTHIWVTIPEGRNSPMLGVCPNGTVTVDWGDGTEPDILTGTSDSVVKWTPKHEYQNPGDYVITLYVDGRAGLSGQNSQTEGSYLFRYSSEGDNRNISYRNYVNKIELSSSTRISTDGLCGLGGLVHASISTNVLIIAGNAFYDCNSLKTVTFKDVQSGMYIMNSAFRNCYNLKSVTIPSGIRAIEQNAFYCCRNIGAFVFPDSLTSIVNNAFYGCYGVGVYDFTKLTAIPSLSNTNAFGQISQDCKILVPSSLYDDWVASTNWTSFASKIVPV